MELDGVYMVFLALWDKLRAHSEQDLWRVLDRGEVVGPCFYDDGYALEARSVEEVFERLNIDHPEDYRRRSLSVGDIVVDPEGSAWVCQRIGWHRLEVRDPEDIRADFSRAAQEFQGDLKAAGRKRNERLLADLLS